MPKASVDEDRDMITRKNEIGPTREATIMKAEAKSKSMERSSNDHLRARVAPFDARHDLAAFLDR
jgi:hypothetical protein